MQFLSSLLLAPLFYSTYLAESIDDPCNVKPKVASIDDAFSVSGNKHTSYYYYNDYEGDNVYDTPAPELESAKSDRVISWRFCDDLWQKTAIGKSMWFNATQITTVLPRARWQEQYDEEKDLQLFCDKKRGTLFSLETDKTRLSNKDAHKGKQCTTGQNHSYALGTSAFLKTNKEYCFTTLESGQVYFKTCEKIQRKKAHSEPLIRKSKQADADISLLDGDKFESEEGSIFFLDGASKTLVKGDESPSKLRNMPISQYLADATEFNNEIWACGGRSPECFFAGCSYRMCWKYNPEREQWQNAVATTYGRYNSRLLKFNETHLMLTGGQLNWLKTTRSTEVYDKRTGVWTRGPLLKYPRYGHCIVKFKGKVFLIGGRVYQGIFARPTEMYDAKANKFRRGRVLPMRGLYNHACVVHNNAIYLSGGVFKARSGEFIISDRTWKSKDGQRWRRLKPKMNYARYGHSMFSHGGDIHIVGGEHPEAKITPENTHEIYGTNRFLGAKMWATSSTFKAVPAVDALKSVQIKKDARRR